MVFGQWAPDFLNRGLRTIWQKFKKYKPVLTVLGTHLYIYTSTKNLIDDLVPTPGK